MADPAQPPDSPPPEAAMPFLGPEFDLPPATGALRSYVIASTPRSGSMLLCDLLHATGRLGVPTEYFNQHDMIVPMARRLGLALPVGMGAYLRALVARRSTGNGVFGAKMHFHQAWAAIDQPAFRRYLAVSRFVWLRRRDVTAQAISLAIATRTNAWFRLRGQADGSEAGDAGEEVDDAVDIGALFDATGRIRAENDFWRGFFQVNGIRPVEIVYEDLLTAPGAAVAAVARLVGVDPGPLPSLDQSRFVAQAAGRSARWRQGLATMLRVVENGAPRG